MTLPTHALLGLLIGQYTGQPLLGLSFAVLPDIDHIYSYVKHGYYKNWNTFYKNAFGREDLHGDQRNILHNLFIFFALSLCAVFVFDHFLTFILSYLSHLILDALDTSDYYPFYPIKNFNIKGFIDFYSRSELCIFILLLFLNSCLFYLL